MFVWFTCATALSSLFSLFASLIFLIFYHPRLHAQPFPFSLSTEINFLTLSRPSLLSWVCLWQLGWVPIGFMVVRFVLWWSDRIYGGLICASVGLCGFDWFLFLFLFFSFLRWWWWCSCGFVIWLRFWWLGVVVLGGGDSGSGCCGYSGGWMGCV